MHKYYIKIVLRINFSFFDKYVSMFSVLHAFCLLLLFTYKIIFLTYEFVFFRLAANDRGYGHGRVAGVIAVALRQGECGRKTCKVHVSQPVNIGVCWQLAVQSLYSRHLFLSSKFLIVNAIISLFCFMCFLLSQLK